MAVKSGVSGRNSVGVLQFVRRFVSHAILSGKLTDASACERALDKRAIERMLRAIVAVLLILWLLGFVLHLAGGIIHILAVIAVAVLIYDLIARKKPVA
jgi:small-conductance mechanosensitive channel